MLSTVTDGCFDVENIALDELGHVLGLGHHVNHYDNRDYGDSVVQTTSRARPRAFWNAHKLGRCDTATLQTRYDMTSTSALYSSCLNLAVNLRLRSSATSISSRSSVTFTATLVVGDNAGDGRLTGNPISNRTIQLQRRPRGTTTWTTVGTMSPSTTSGSYTLRQSPTATYEWRAVFPEPSGEGLRGAASTAVTVTVSGCSGTTCPQSAPVDTAADKVDGG